MSTYPPAPWTLGGWGIATLGLVDSAAAGAFVPAGAQLVTVMPGKTIGGLFFLSYDRGSLVYRELNVAAGLVRIGKRFAFMVPRLYVDSVSSVAGGRDIWGLPKELASFAITHKVGATSIEVRQGSRMVCRLDCTESATRLHATVPLPSFGVRANAFLFFTGTLRSKMSLTRVRIEFPGQSEFATLGLARPGIAMRCEDLSLVVPAPRSVSRSI